MTAAAARATGAAARTTGAASASLAGRVAAQAAEGPVETRAAALLVKATGVEAREAEGNRAAETMAGAEGTAVAVQGAVAAVTGEFAHAVSLVKPKGLPARSSRLTRLVD